MVKMPIFFEVIDFEKTSFCFFEFVILLSSFFAMPAFAQAPPLVKGTSYYIDSVDGNDFSSGLSPASAWKTAAKINSVNLNPVMGFSSDAAAHMNVP
jgi:hypothetical protein